MSKDKMTLAEAKQFVKQHIGKDEIISFKGEDVLVVESIPSGSMLVDKTTGVGGIPKGRMTELYGMPSSGKTTLMLHTCKNVQAAGTGVLYLDYEHAFNPDYAKLIGIDLSSDKFILVQPESFESGMKIAEIYIKNNLVGLVVVDSLASMVTQKEWAAEVGESGVAILAKAMSQELRRLNSMVKDSNAAMIFINHVHEVIETGFAKRSGAKRTTTPGGRALKFYASMRIELTMIENIKGKVQDDVSGSVEERSVAVKIKTFVAKNKVAAPFGIGYFYIRHNYGIDDVMIAVDIAVKRGIIEQKGARFLLPASLVESPGSDVKSLNGMAQLLRYFMEKPKMKDALLDEVRQMIKMGGSEIDEIGIAKEDDTDLEPGGEETSLEPFPGEPDSGSVE
jgi:recombination protein RecA